MRLLTKILLFVLPIMALAQGGISDKIASLISSGNEAGLKAYFDQSVEVITPEGSGVYSQNQAEQVVKKFFDKYPCNSFTVDHKVNSAGGSQLLIGSYTSAGKTFRTSIFLKQSGEKFLIQELSFEE